MLVNNALDKLQVDNAWHAWGCQNTAHQLGPAGSQQDCRPQTTQALPAAQAQQTCGVRLAPICGSMGRQEPDRHLLSHVYLYLGPNRYLHKSEAMSRTVRSRCWPKRLQEQRCWHLAQRKHLLLYGGTQSGAPQHTTHAHPAAQSDSSSASAMSKAFTGKAKSARRLSRAGSSSAAPKHTSCAGWLPVHSS